MTDAASVLAAEQAVVAAVICRQQRDDASAAAQAQSLSPCRAPAGYSDTVLLQLRRGNAPQSERGPHRAMPSHSEPLPIIRTHGSFVGAPEEPGNGEAGMLEPAAAAAPDCGTRTAFMSAILHSSRLMMDDAHRALEQPMSTSFPDASQRPPSYCSSRSSSGDGGTSSAGLGADGTGAAAGEASAADASSSTAPPSSVHRYGSLMMNSAGWRLAYGIDLHDALLLDRLTPRRTSARQPQQQPQQRTSRASTPELSGASFAAALRAAISAASAARAGSVAVPVLPAALEALGPLGGVQAAPVQQPASPAVTTTQAGYALGTPPRLSPCIGRPPRGPPVAAAEYAATPEPLPQLYSAEVTAATAAALLLRFPSPTVSYPSPNLRGPGAMDSQRGASTSSTPTKTSATSFRRNQPPELQQASEYATAPTPQTVSPRQRVAQQPHQPPHMSPDMESIRSPKSITVSHVKVRLTTAASLPLGVDASPTQSALSVANMAVMPKRAGPGTDAFAKPPSSPQGLALAAAREQSSTVAAPGGETPRALGSSPAHSAYSPGSPYKFACRSHAYRRLSESQAARPIVSKKGCPELACAQPAAAPPATPAAKHAATSPSGTQCSGGAMRPHLSGGPDLVALARHEGSAWGPAMALSGMRVPSQRTPSRCSGRGSSLTSWASVTSPQGQLPPPPSAIRCSPGGGGAGSCGGMNLGRDAGGSIGGDGRRSPVLAAHPSAGSLLADSGTPGASRRTSYHSSLGPSGHMPLHLMQRHSHSCFGASPAGQPGVRTGSVASWGEVLEVLREQVTPRATTPRASSGRAGGSPFCNSPAGLAAATTATRGRIPINSSFEASRSNYQSNGGCSFRAPSEGGCGSGCGVRWAAAVLRGVCCTSGRDIATLTGGEDQMTCIRPDAGRVGGSDGDAGVTLRCHQGSSTRDISWWRRTSASASLSLVRSSTNNLASQLECPGHHGGNAGTTDLLRDDQAAARLGDTGLEEVADAKVDLHRDQQSGYGPDTVAGRDEQDAVHSDGWGPEIQGISNLDRSYADARRNSFAPLAAAIFAAQRPLEPVSAPTLQVVKTPQTGLAVAASALALASCLSPSCGRDHAPVSP